MAWRIDEFVVRGEIDNRTRGRVTGRIWLVGREEPVELDLTGDAWRDLAGRRLEFKNPSPKTGDVSHLADRQNGVIGDCTASRKVKVPDIPLDQVGAYYAAKKPWTWHWGNCLYLEWFSEANGRVVIESVAYQLAVSPESAWDMTPVEEEQQRRANAAALARCLEQMSEAVGEMAGERPMSEAEAEQLQEEGDRLIDRIEARLEREGADARFEDILEEEIERRRRERGEAPAPEQEAQRLSWLEDLNRAAAESARYFNPSEEWVDSRHPVAQRAYALAIRLMQEPEQRGWTPSGAGEEHPLVDLAAATMKAGAKLASALNGGKWPPPVILCAYSIVRLKRARGYLEDALRAAEHCQHERLADDAWLLEAGGELHALADECEALLAELRAKLERGRD